MTPAEVRERVDRIRGLAESGDVAAARDEQRALFIHVLTGIAHGAADPGYLAWESVRTVEFIAAAIHAITTTDTPGQRS